MDDKDIQELKQYIVDCQMVSYISLCDYISQVCIFLTATNRIQAEKKRPKQPREIFEDYFNLFCEKDNITLITNEQPKKHN